MNDMVKNKIFVTKGLRDLILINENVIQSLKSQKARNIKLFDKYQKEIRVEAERPANRLMLWIQFINPFIERSIDMQVLDYDIGKRYERYVKEIINENQNQLIASNNYDDLSIDFERILEQLLSLEKIHVDLQTTATIELNGLRLRGIDYYSKLPIKFKQRLKGGCRYCGAELDPVTGDEKDQCRHCLQVPTEIKELSEQNAKKNAEGELKNSEDMKKKDDQDKVVSELMGDNAKAIINYNKNYGKGGKISNEIKESTTKKEV